MTAGLLPRERRVLAPGAVHVPDWLDLTAQRDLVRACRAWAAEGPGIRAARMPNGAPMSVRSVCLGWHWYPYRYSRTRDDQDGSPVTPFPRWLADLGRRAVAAAYLDPDRGARYRPDIALINHYDDGARMGLHRDSDEESLEPVVSLSIGAACLFRFGNTENRGRPWTDVDPGVRRPGGLRRRGPAGLPRCAEAAAGVRDPGQRPRERSPQRHAAGVRVRCNRAVTGGVSQA